MLPFNTVKWHLRDAALAQRVVEHLVERSAWFQIQPLPDDQYELLVKPEHDATVHRLVLEPADAAPPQPQRDRIWSLRATISCTPEVRAPSKERALALAEVLLCGYLASFNDDVPEDWQFSVVEIVCESDWEADE